MYGYKTLNARDILNEEPLQPVGIAIETGIKKKDLAYDRAARVDQLLMILRSELDEKEELFSAILEAGNALGIDTADQSGSHAKNAFRILKTISGNGLQSVETSEEDSKRKEMAKNINCIVDAFNNKTLKGIAAAVVFQKGGDVSTESAGRLISSFNVNSLLLIGLLEQLKRDIFNNNEQQLQQVK